MFKKKKESLIPLPDLLSALRVIRLLRFKHEAREALYDRNGYTFALFYEDRTYSDCRIKEEIIKHGYTEVNDKFYNNEELAKLAPLPGPHIKIGDKYYSSTALDLLQPLDA